MKQIFIFSLFLINVGAFTQAVIPQDCSNRFYVEGNISCPDSIHNGKKEGKWVEYYTRNWKNTSKLFCKYFRLIEYSGGKPIGKVYDFYRLGKLQMTGQYEFSEYEIKKDTFLWYSKKGAIEGKSIFYADSSFSETYYRNGGLEHYDFYLRGRDLYSFHHYISYYRNGKIKYFNYRDDRKDSSFYVSGRRNGTVNFQILENKQIYESYGENRGGEVVKRQIRYRDSVAYAFKTRNGDTVKTDSFSVEFPDDKYLGFAIVKEYQKLDMNKGLSDVLFIDWTNNGDTVNTYMLDGKEISEEKYHILLDSINKPREKKHYYKYYLADSTLAYEGLYKNTYSPCGSYTSYYLSGGGIQCRGYYDRKSRRNGNWIFYDLNGDVLYYEFYKKGVFQE